MITIVAVVVLVAVEIVASDTECPQGPIKNCCDLGYNNNNYNTKKPGTYLVTDFCGVNFSKTKLYCDTTSGGGGWTIIHRRQNGRINFTDRDWVEYEDGFGSYSSEFWMGLRSMHCLTRQGTWELRVDYTLNNGTKSYLHYNKFAVGPSTDQYQLSISGFDSLGLTDPFSYLNGKRFSSRDRDHDEHPTVNCGRTDGGWWHLHCAGIEPNDHYEERNILLNSEWLVFKYMEIKIRPLHCQIHN